MEATTAEKIACLKREVAMRENVYPKWVASGRMTQVNADREIRVLKAVLHDYEPARLL